jgi:hypothetical protein
MVVPTSPLDGACFQALSALDALADDSNFSECAAHRTDQRRKVEPQDVEEYLPVAKPTHFFVAWICQRRICQRRLRVTSWLRPTAARFSAKSSTLIATENR